VIAVGIGAGAAAAGAYNVGVVLQAMDARDAPQESGLRMALLYRLARQPRWLLGTLLGLAAFPIQVLAYANAPVAVVQACLAAGLTIVLFLGARSMGEGVGTRDWLAVLAIVVGVALTAAAAPDGGAMPRRGAEPLLLMGALGAAALVPYVVSRRLSAVTLATSLSAGLAFAWSDVATKLFSDAFSSDVWLLALAWLAGVCVSAVVATLSQMTAFQRLAATRVVPAVFVVETLVPVLAAPIVLRTHLPWWSPSAVAFYLGLALLIGAIVVIGRTGQVATILLWGTAKARLPRHRPRFSAHGRATPNRP